MYNKDKDLIDPRIGSIIMNNSDVVRSIKKDIRNIKYTLKDIENYIVYFELHEENTPLSYLIYTSKSNNIPISTKKSNTKKSLLEFSQDFIKTHLIK